MRAVRFGLVAMLALLSGCTMVGAEREPVVLGAVYNLSGAQAELDVPSAQGARLAVEQANRQGGVLGRPVHLELADGESEPERVAERTRDLLDRAPQAAAVFGLSDTDMVLAAAPVAAEAGRVFLTSGATSPELPAQVPDFLFLTPFGDNVQAAAAAEWARRALDARTVAILYDTRHAYTRLLQGYFQTRFEQVGGTVVAKEGFDGDDLGRAIWRIGAPELIFLATEAPEDALDAVRQLRGAGIRAPILGGDGYDSAAVWQSAPEVQEVYFTSHAWLGEDNSDPAVVAFRDAYQEAYPGEEPGAFAALGYDAAGLLLAAIEDAGDDEPGAVRAALGQIDGYTGVTGTIAYPDDSRIPSKSVSLLGVQGGAIRLVDEFTPSRVPPP